MTNAELIKALRYCPTHGCGRCVAIDENGKCKVHGIAGMMESAAAALEAAEKRIAELEAQMPKRGEWFMCESEKPYIVCKCSVCGGLTSEGGHYRPNCGARMKGEQE